VATAPLVVPTPQLDLEAAARLIAEQLPEQIRDYLYEVAYVANRQPLWTVIGGHVLRAYDNGTMSAPLIDPSWTKHFGTVGIDLKDTRYECDWPDCRAEFTPTRFRQRYHSQECGMLAAKAQADAERAAAKGKRG
jgi:hypothetical protein